MRHDTREQIKEAVYTLENNFLSPMSEGDDAPIELSTAIEYVYHHLVEYALLFHGNTTAIKFDGKKNIMAEIERQILANKNIKLKG